MLVRPSHLHRLGDGLRGDEVRVGLAYRGVRVSREPKSVGTPAQLSVVVGFGSAVVAFGIDLDLDERARVAILIDHHCNGVG